MWTNKKKGSGEIRPTNIVPAYAMSGKSLQPALFPMVWGFKLSDKGSLIINARVETAAKKPAFKESWLKHRCAVPASWFYGWEHHKLSDVRTLTGDKHLIQPVGMERFYFAGLYRLETVKGYNGDNDLKYPVFAILTKDASEGIKEIHDRVPVMISRRDARDMGHSVPKPQDLLRRINDCS